MKNDLMNKIYLTGLIDVRGRYKFWPRLTVGFITIIYISSYYLCHPLLSTRVLFSCSLLARITYSTLFSCSVLLRSSVFNTHGCSLFVTTNSRHHISVLTTVCWWSCIHPLYTRLLFSCSVLTRSPVFTSGLVVRLSGLVVNQWSVDCSRAALLAVLAPGLTCVCVGARVGVRVTRVAQLPGSWPLSHLCNWFALTLHDLTRHSATCLKARRPHNAQQIPLHNSCPCSRCR